MKRNNKAKTTSASSGKTSPTSGSLLHANKPLLIDIDNVSVRLGNDLALEAVSLCIHANEFIGLIGPNGAGKTTLLRAMLGLQSVDQGSIQREAVRIGYIPQRGQLYSGLVPISVREVVRLGAHGTANSAEQALQRVGMETFADRRFTELSGGQQQRVAIAKALAGNANILMLDEPTTGIDEQSQATFYKILKDLQQQGVTIIIVTHEVEAVLKLVTRIICLNRAILYDGAPEHFDADVHMPNRYKEQHIQLHHGHGGQHA
jgi:zinc transport system ATP-binding protein